MQNKTVISANNIYKVDKLKGNQLAAAVYSVDDRLNAAHIQDLNMFCSKELIFQTWRQFFSCNVYSVGKSTRILRTGRLNDGKKQKNLSKIQQESDQWNIVSPSVTQCTKLSENSARISEFCAAQ